MKTYKIEVTHIGRNRTDGHVAAYRYGVKRWCRYCRNDAEIQTALVDCRADLSKDGEGVRYAIAIIS